MEFTKRFHQFGSFASNIVNNTKNVQMPQNPGQVFCIGAGLLGTVVIKVTKKKEKKKDIRICSQLHLIVISTAGLFQWILLSAWLVVQCRLDVPYCLQGGHVRRLGGLRARGPVRADATGLLLDDGRR